MGTFSPGLLKEQALRGKMEELNKQYREQLEEAKKQIEKAE